MHTILQETEHELLHYPNRNWKNIVKRLIGKEKAVDEINWPTGLLAKSLIEYYLQNTNSEESERILYYLKKYYDRWMKRGCRIQCLDDALSGETLIDMHLITGDEQYKKAVDGIFQYLLKHETDERGSYPYRPKQKNGYVFADGIGLVCPFLCKYGKTYNNSQAIRIAILQIKNYIEYGMDSKTGLPYHGYSYQNKTKYGIIGWGRAVGWLMIGISECLTYLEENNMSYKDIKEFYIQLVEKVENYQLDNGLFCWQLETKEGPIDTSATAMILYAIAKTLNTNILPKSYKSRILQGKEALSNLIYNGKVYNCLAECQGFSLYPQVYGAYPWSLGPTLSLFVMMKKESI